MDKVKVKTKDGFECEVDPRAFDDMEFFDALNDVMRIDGKTEMTQKDNMEMITGISTISRKLLGDQRKAFYAFYEDDDGFVTYEKAVPAVLEMMQSVKTGKN